MNGTFKEMIPRRRLSTFSSLTKEMGYYEVQPLSQSLSEFYSEMIKFPGIEEIDAYCSQSNWNEDIRSRLMTA